MARTHMSICEKRQDEIFEIIIHCPHIINWLSIGRLEPSADAICDAAHYMEKGSIEHTEMKEALKSVFEKLTNAKEIRYYRQLKLLAIMFDKYFCEKECTKDCTNECADKCADACTDGCTNKCLQKCSNKPQYEDIKKGSLSKTLKSLAETYEKDRQNFKPLSYRDLKKRVCL